MALRIRFRSFQQLIRDMYLEKDVARGVDGTFMWLMEEVGELAAALRSGTHEEERLGEFADVLAWPLRWPMSSALISPEAVLRESTGLAALVVVNSFAFKADAEKP